MAEIVNVTAPTPGQTRVTFTSSEVGNGNPNDSNTMSNQDGGLAVRLQAEAADGTPTGSVTRYGDEDIVFVAGGGITFDVRDLVSGVQRGDRFEVVQLGTEDDDVLTPFAAGRPTYINAGRGNDTVTGGTADDFLVGGAGNDTLAGNDGNDSFIGGVGDDTISGGIGNDTAIINLSTDGADTIDLGTGSDRVTVATAAAGQVRLSFTSAEVGNGSANDGGSLANQDGGLAVRMQAENGSDGLTGPVTRIDDEGTTFVAGTGVTFDVRDLVSGVQRGDQFRTATLGTNAGETLTGTGEADYINAGQGNDLVQGGAGNDFLVGGAGNDTLDGGTGSDGLLGGGGDDIFLVDNSRDRVLEQVGQGEDRVFASTSYALAAGQEVESLQLLVSTGRSSFNLTGNEFANSLVGNIGDNVLNGGAGADRLIGRDGNDTYIVDNAGDQVFESRGGGNDRVFAFTSYALAAGEEIEALQLLVSTGRSNFNLTGNEFANSLVGNIGDNVLNGGAGADRLTGRDGNDTFVFDSALGGTNVDLITDFSGQDRVQLSSAIFSTLTAGDLDGEAFKDIGAGGTVDESDRIIYDSTSGSLSYDADGSGSGAAVQFATLGNRAALSASDIIIV